MALCKRHDARRQQDVEDREIEQLESNNSFLSTAEFQEAVAGSAKTVFTMFDSNKDGQLTEAEASAAMNAAGLRLGMPKLAQKD